MCQYQDASSAYVLRMSTVLAASSKWKSFKAFPVVDSGVGMALGVICEVCEGIDIYLW